MGVLRQQVIPQRKGTSQHTRLSEKLMPGYFSIDERSVSDFLAFIAGYSSYIDFPDPEAEKKGQRRSWQDVFTKDISVLLSGLVSIDLDRVDSHFEHLVQRVQACYEPIEKEGTFQELFTYLVDQAKRLPFWYAFVSRIPAGPDSIEYEVETELYKVIDQRLREALVLLNEVLQQGKSVGFLKDIKDLPFPSYPAGIETPENEEELQIFRGSNTMRQFDAALVEMRTIYHIILNSLAYAKSHFQDYFERSITEKSDHHPDVGLLISFLKLYSFAQKDLNELTLRHLEYYYKHILQQKYRPAISDAVHVCFELASTSRSCRIPEGALLLAGREADGLEIHYRTTEEVEINQASIGSLKSVFISRVLEGQTWTYKLVTGFYAAPVANSKDGRGAPFDQINKDWSLFGEEQYKAGRVTMQAADIGFAIASPMFQMAEGTRKVKIHLNFSEEPHHQGTYRKLIEDLAKPNVKDVDEQLRDALLEVFGRGQDCTFRILVSGAQGWIDVADEASNELYIESKPWNWNRVTVCFTIPASCPPITAINPNVMNPEGLSTKFPTVKFILNPRKTPFGYTFLETLRFDQIDIEVEVDKVKSIVVFNDLGRLDPTQPFQAFGPIPRPGSYLMVGNAEVFRKKLDSIKFYFDWQNLPSRGLRAYYKEYFDGDAEISEEMFKVNLSALSGYEFKPGEKEDPITHMIFPSEPGRTLSTINIADTNRLSIRTNPDMREVEHFDNNTQVGFFKFELKEPREAFGHNLYQERLSMVAQHNANPDEENKLKYPNPPFAPMLRTIYMSYKASDRIIFEQFEPASRNEIFHIHPFGTAEVYSRGSLKMKHGPVIPEYRHDGYLYIGLRDLIAPQEVSFLFQLAAGKTTFTAQLPETEWSYFTGTEWEPMRLIDVLSDTTERFTKSGIIRLRIPASITDRAGILPTGLFWLRVSIQGDTENVSRALDIRTQAVKAEWVDNGRSERLREPLKAGSIRDLLKKHPEVRDVVQPYPSFHARAAEVRDEFFQRVSERLRHKGRAITHWDYERMVLERFHTVSQVKCLSHISDPDYIQPGELRVVVIPGANQGTDELTPKVNHGTLLAVQNYLRDSASPFVNIRVSNPSYEYLRVNCRVRFAHNKNNGDSLEKLRRDIQSFICPWLDTLEREIEIGGRIKVEDLYRFIKSLPYVDFVTKFAVLHFYIDDESTGIYQLLSTADPRLAPDERTHIKARKPWSVLIPDIDHEIEFTERDVEVAPDFSLEPVDFQGRFQISPHLIRIIPKPEAVKENPAIRYEQEDSLRIFVEIPD
jgi:hypothetical protein